MEKKIPTGIRIIGIYHKWWGGVFAFFASSIILTTLFFSEFLPQFVNGLKQQGWSILYYKIYLSLGIAIAPISFILGKGILNLKKMSRKGLVYLNIFSLITFQFITIKGNSSSGLNSRLLGIILYGAIIFYLTRPKVKEQFK